jgi:GNAT superfamily N-acetyltransferase
MSGRFLFGEGSAQRVENKFSLPLEDNDYIVERGWHDQLAEELVERSKEEEIRRWTKDDAERRFPDTEAARHWYEEHEHTVYALGKTAALDGVVWFSRRERPELNADYTLAIRMYEGARGRGLAGALLKTALKDFGQFKQYEGAIWLGTDDDNVHARRLYEHHGFTVVGQEEARTIMVREAGQ